jgi:hypothetical protein
MATLQVCPWGFEAPTYLLSSHWCSAVQCSSSSAAQMPTAAHHHKNACLPALLLSTHVQAVITPITWRLTQEEHQQSLLALQARQVRMHAYGGTDSVLWHHPAVHAFFHCSVQCSTAVVCCTHV